jgi:non-homologous end joining protein Ku
MRPIWSGTISFGLVSVPVRMFPATNSKELRFHFLDKNDLTPIAYEKVRRADRRPVDADEIVRGFEKQGEVVDLMAALRESVERTKKLRKAPSKRKAS